jgi:hypothetical protein
MKTIRKILQETNVSAGIGVRGFGDVTGNPATTEDSENSHIDRVLQGAEENNKYVQEYINSHNTTYVLQEPETDNWWSKTGTKGAALTGIGKHSKTVSKIMKEAKDIEEEVAGTSSGAGQIAGLGSTSSDKPANFAEPGVPPNTDYKRQNAIMGQLLRRRLSNITNEQ